MVPIGQERRARISPLFRRLRSSNAAFEEQTRGSLTPGKMADLVVWSDDFYSVEPEDIANVEAELTMVAGEIVHER